MARIASKKGSSRKASSKKKQPAKKAKKAGSGKPGEEPKDPWSQTFELLAETTQAQAEQYHEIAEKQGAGEYGPSELFDDWREANVRAIYYWTKLNKIWMSGWPLCGWPVWCPPKKARR